MQLNNQTRRRQYEKYYNKNSQSRPLQINDKVIVYSPVLRTKLRTTKLQPPYTGPYVVQQIRGKNYLVKIDKGHGKSFWVHVDRTLPFSERTNNDEDTVQLSIPNHQPAPTPTSDAIRYYQEPPPEAAHSSQNPTLTPTHLPPTHIKGVPPRSYHSDGSDIQTRAVVHTPGPQHEPRSQPRFNTANQPDSPNHHRNGSTGLFKRLVHTFKPGQ